MSWILGIAGNDLTEATIRSVRSLCPEPLHSVQKIGKLFVAAGGNNETLHCIDNNEFSCIIAGCGILIEDDTSRILTTNDWESIVTKEQPDLQSLNGHFVIIRFRNNILECYSDRVGLRTLYFGKSGDSWVFSSKLAWVCKFVPDTKIDWKIFGGRWLSLQQFSFNSPLTNTFRLPPNGYSIIDKNGFDLSSHPWITIPKNSGSPESIFRVLSSLIKVPDKRIALGLSGGFDSRLLLAILSHFKKDFFSYSFGYPSEPDVLLAKKIAEFNNIPFQLFPNVIPSQDECLRQLTSYVEQTNAASPASESQRLNQYEKLHQSNVIMIDGGNGEIARRQFLNRLAVRHRYDVMELKTDNILPSLSLRKADIFNAETLDTMNLGARVDIDQSLRSLPPPAEIGVENFLDVWIATTRIPNVGADEQARIDEHILNFMPFSQPVFINSALQLPLRYRKNSLLFRDLMDRLEPSLALFPLVKNNISYPYSLTTLQARLWTTMKSKLFGKYDDPLVHEFLHAIKEFVLDSARSTRTKQYPYYDYKKIQALIEGYYNGNKNLAGEVNWWIAFDVWRNMVEK